MFLLPHRLERSCEIKSGKKEHSAARHSFLVALPLVSADIDEPVLVHDGVDVAVGTDNDAA